jgi:hypothetical protein
MSSVPRCYETPHLKSPYVLGMYSITSDNYC